MLCHYGCKFVRKLIVLRLIVAMKTNVVLLDDHLERAEDIRRLLAEHGVSTRREVSLDTDVAVVHWSMIDRAYRKLALLRSLKQIQFVFYCFCPERRELGTIWLVPEEIDEMIRRILKSQSSRCHRSIISCANKK
jgi:hypothetical protein